MNDGESTKSNAITEGKRNQKQISIYSHFSKLVKSVFYSYQFFNSIYYLESLLMIRAQPFDGIKSIFKSNQIFNSCQIT